MKKQTSFRVAFSLVEVVVSSTIIALIFVSLGLFFNNQSRSFAKEKQLNQTLRQQLFLFQTLSYCFYHKTTSTSTHPSIYYSTEHNSLFIQYCDHTSLHSHPTYFLELNFNDGIILSQKKSPDSPPLNKVHLFLLQLDDLSFFSSSFEEISPSNLHKNPAEAFLLKFTDTVHNKKQEILFETPLFTP